VCFLGLVVFLGGQMVLRRKGLENRSGELVSLDEEVGGG
jgi:hypothetical protein